MRRIWLAAMLMAPLAAPAQAQSYPAGTVLACSTAFEMTWTSVYERGYYSNRVDLVNKLSQPVEIAHVFTGPGAIGSAPRVIAARAPARREVSRTTNRYSPNEIIAATRLTCTAR
ncbi:hypothetical protein [Roseococcus sp. YIM B11640]|uniref:hypothetical protein n=1 Tax=Roseococcus sp. YIM B11640 TaxID=3133973 RepID=UPI003C7D79F1